MVRATAQPRSTLCTACFTGDYPMDVADAAAAAGSDLFTEDA